MTSGEPKEPCKGSHHHHQRESTPPVTEPTAPLPTDEPTDAELAAASTIRPLDQLPSPVVVVGDPPVLSQLSLKALSLADQKIVMDRANGTSEGAINAALFGFLRERRNATLIKCGAGEGATETEREALCQMNQLRLMTEEYNRIVGELDEVSEHRTEYDAEGNATPVPVYVHQGDSRSARNHRLTEIKSQMAQLHGRESEVALREAARKEALKTRQINQQLEDGREIERRAHELARDERINEAARRKASILKSNLG